ncbi:MAG: sterol desaturase family protein [Gammaproteobacteria bacterium]|nr:sterol desaturase family protein [Gammaproteobacteria bacterium]
MAYRALLVGSYPLTIVACYAVYSLLTQTMPVAYAAYVSAVFGGALVTLHEWLLPYRRFWHPTLTDLANDSAYMVFGQVALERLLVLSAFVVVASFAASSQWRVPGLWPYDFPVWVQAVMILVLGDFLRYWMHRGFHRFGWMWRLHAVHHSPQRLYWLNVGRFHPFEQSLQFGVDALPFIVLGISPEVLSVYFVFYAINGFYQHSNCDVRLGWLNWVVAGPELHRWHHSINLDEANHNFGNNLIIWDGLFGTRYFPRDRDVSVLGIPVPNYPMNFLRQMVAPFDRRISMD